MVYLMSFGEIPLPPGEFPGRRFFAAGFSGILRVTFKGKEFAGVYGAGIGVPNCQGFCFAISYSEL